MVKKLFAYIFLLLICFQALPIKEIGEILANGQITEEVQDHGGDGQPIKVKRVIDFFYLNNNSCNLRGFSGNSSYMQAVHDAERVPHQHLADILTPPPNLA